MEYFLHRILQPVGFLEKDVHELPLGMTPGKFIPENLRRAFDGSEGGVYFMGQGSGEPAQGGKFLRRGQPGLRLDELGGFLLEPGIGRLEFLGQLPVPFAQAGLSVGDHPDQQACREIKNYLGHLA